MSRKRKELPILETFELTDIAAEGNALGRTESGMVVFVPFGAPGDVADIKLDKKKKSFAIGHLAVGLKDRMRHLPRELSGGERQRVAVARALMNCPDILLADEPSGNLDERNARMLNELFKRINEDYKQTLLVVTHDERMAEYATSRVHMHGGKIVPFSKEAS